MAKIMRMLRSKVVYSRESLIVHGRSDGLQQNGIENGLAVAVSSQRVRIATPRRPGQRQRIHYKSSTTLTIER